MNLKEVKQRIASVKNTQKITSAMKLISASKLRKAQAAVESMLPYQNKLGQMLSGFLAGENHFETPYTEQRSTARVALFVCSSNGSLCGGFNVNVIRRFREAVGEYEATIGSDNIFVYTVGRKVTDVVRKMKLPHHVDIPELTDMPQYNPAARVAMELMRLFVDKKIDKVEFIYNHFKTTSQQQMIRSTFLPIDLAESVDDKGLAAADYIVEPTVDEVMSKLIPKVLCLKLFTVLLDTEAAEHAARLIAMQVATDNADELITDLTREYNKGRQQAITNELLDIASGSLE